MLEDIRLSLDNNLNLTREVKARLFELIVIFNNKFPSVDLSNLNKRIKTLKIEKNDNFLNKDISMYDFRTNILYLNTKEMEKQYDIRHVLMFELLNIITSNNFSMGFNTDGRLEALNVGYTEVLANYLVGNNGEVQIFPEEATMANIITTVVGFDNMFNAYVNNDSRILLKKISRSGGKFIMENGFYSSMALANTRLKEKRSGNVSISYTQTLQSLLSLFNEEQIKKISEWIPTNGKTIDITEDLSGFKSYTEQKEKKSKTI